MKEKIIFSGIPIDTLSMSETIQIIDRAIKRNKNISHVAINANKIVSARRNKELYESILECDIVSADGQWIVWVSRLFSGKKIERVTGIDLMYNLLELSVKRGYKCYFLGAHENIIQQLVLNISKKYGKNIIAGFRNGYFGAEEEPEIVNNIIKSNANILFVGISSPQKELFISRYKKCFSSINFIMGVGGSFDIIAGKRKRSPNWLQSLGMEWLYRLIQEPSRMWKRYLFGGVAFLRIVIRESIMQRKNVKLSETQYDRK